MGRPGGLPHYGQNLRGRRHTATRETDVELLQLAIKVRPLEPGLLGDAAHVALLLAEQLLLRPAQQYLE